MKRTKPQMTVKYVAIPGGVLNRTTAPLAGAEIDRITRERGCCKPAQLVKDSKPVTAPLHNEFTWDDSECGVIWRNEEASRIIRSVRIVYAEMPEAEQPVIRAFLNVKASDEETQFEGQAYVPLAKVQSSEDYRQQVLNKAKQELRDWSRRYEDYKDLFTAQMKSVAKLAAKV